MMTLLMASLVRTHATDPDQDNSVARPGQNQRRSLRMRGIACTMCASKFLSFAELLLAAYFLPLSIPSPLSRDPTKMAATTADCSPKLHTQRISRYTGGRRSQLN
ncbi:hypothetical protein MPLB_1760061 [Mesorhizobium sp. ORS 3324]|nr:hypothetical protein MPLB_1760061 [Mesorhizobium sp. ORS 3324]